MRLECPFCGERVAYYFDSDGAGRGEHRTLAGWLERKGVMWRFWCCPTKNKRDWWNETTGDLAGDGDIVSLRKSIREKVIEFPAR